MADPRSPAFWATEDAALWEVLAPLVMNSLLAGANGGVAALPSELLPLVNWDFFNQSALAFLRDYRLSTVAGITKTTADQAIAAIDDWARSGQHLDSLKATLRPIFGATRADMIAVTEVTRIFAQGNLSMWQSTGVVGGKMWRTARDERVCPICRPLDGQIVSLDGDFSLTPSAVATSPAMRSLLGDNYDPERAMQRANTIVRNVGARHTAPPAHVRCRCWLSPAVSEQLLEEQIGAILAGQFFARVQSDNLAISVI